MIIHLATRAGRKTLKHVSGGRMLGSRVQVLLYDELEARTVWPCGLYLFTDMERMNEAERQQALRLHGRLQAFPDRVLTLNHPFEHLKRYELLRTLHERGLNEFNVHRASAIPDDVRYPAFLRYADMHNGPLTDPLPSRAELEGALAGLVAEGHPIERLLVVEFADTSDGDGVFYKYGSHRFGEHIVAGHLYASTGWSAKSGSNRRELARKKEVEWLRSFPEREQVREAFEIARLEYGRMDYAVKNGRIQVWEINDNPSMGVTFIKRRVFKKWRARRLMRPARRRAFQDLVGRLDLRAPPPEFELGE